MAGKVLATIVARALAVGRHLQEELGLRSHAHLITSAPEPHVSVAAFVRFEYPGAYGLLTSGSDIVRPAGDGRTSPSVIRQRCALGTPRRRGADTFAAAVAERGNARGGPTVTTP